MMRRARNCAVWLCSNNSIENPNFNFHRFPRPKERCLSWRTLCGNPSLSALPAEKLAVGSYFVCSAHFRENDYTNTLGKTLNRNAFPSLLLPQQDQKTSNNGNEVSSQLFGEQTQPESTFGLTKSLPYLEHQSRCHMVEEMPELYTNIILPYLEKEPLYVKWVYDIINGEADQERIVYQTPCKDDKDGFLMIKDGAWDGENLERLHLIALPYRPGLLTLRDLRASHLSLLRNIYIIGKAVVEEKYGIPGSQLRIFLQYLPSFYHLHIHFTMVEEEIYGTHVGRAHLLYSVINNLMLCPNYYEVANLQFYVEESHILFRKFKACGLIGKIRSTRCNSRDN